MNDCGTAHPSPAKRRGADSVRHEIQARLAALVAHNVVAQELIAARWTFKVSRGRRGFCYWVSRSITIPTHALVSEQPGYAEYYLAHEMAHAKAGKKAAHGPEFMDWLKRLCPPEFVHYELGYKPRNAKAAGIKGKL